MISDFYEYVNALLYIYIFLSFMVRISKDI